MTSMLVSFLILAGLSLPAWAVQDNQEPICDSPAVIFCENFEARAVGNGDMTRHTYKNHGWIVSGGQGVTTDLEGVRSGSKGYELRFPAGYNVGPGFLLGNFFATDAEIYVREYHKYSSNFVFSQAGNKRSKVTNGQDGSVHILQQASSGVPWANTSQDGYTRALYTRVTHGLTPPWYNPPNAQDNYLLYPTVPDAQKPWFQPGIWYCVESHIKMNSTPTTPDGAFEVWVDGVLKGQNTGLIIDRTATGSNRNWNVFWMDGYANCWIDTQPEGSGACVPGTPNPPPNVPPPFPLNKPSGSWHPQQSRWYDNIVVSTQRIGCVSGATPSDGTPPAPPSQFRISALLGPK